MPMAKNTVPSWFYRQSAAIPFRIGPDGLLVLLITSRGRKRWIVPKGVVEPELSPAESAQAEAYEEAGVRGGIVGEPLGSYSYKKWGGTCTVEVFALEVSEEFTDWPEGGERTRRWLPLREAAKLADDKPVGALIRALEKRQSPKAQ